MAVWRFDQLRYDATLPVFRLTERAGADVAPTMDYLMQNLVAFRGLGETARRQWDRWVFELERRTVLTGAGVAFGFPSKADNHAQHVIRYARRLRMWRENAFGVGSGETDVNDSARIVGFPWCLTDAEFEQSYGQLRDGKLPSLKGVPSDWEKQIDYWSKIAGALATLGAMLIGGGSAKILTSAAKWGGAGFTLTSAIGYGGEWVARGELMDLYQADAARRRRVVA